MMQISGDQSEYTVVARRLQTVYGIFGSIANSGISANSSAGLNVMSIKNGAFRGLHAPY